MLTAKKCSVHELCVVEKNQAVMVPPTMIPSMMDPPIMIPSMMNPPIMIPSMMAPPMMILCNGFICFHVITVPKCPEPSMQILSPSFSAAVLCMKQVDKDME